MYYDYKYIGSNPILILWCKNIFLHHINRYVLACLFPNCLYFFIVLFITLLENSLIDLAVSSSVNEKAVSSHVLI